MSSVTKANKLIGQKFNRLTIIAFDHIDEKHHAIVKVKCDCGNEKLLKASAVKLGRVKSCGCLPKDLGKINTPLIKNKAKGANNANWRGGVTLINEMQRKSDTYKLWRLKVFRRDSFTCQKCNQRKRNIEAHHLFDFANYPQYRLDLDNGATLCEECHISFHRIYGYKTENTIHQFYAFLNQ